MIILQRDAKIEKLVKDVLIKAKSGSKISEGDGEIDSRTKFCILNYLQMQVVYL